MIDSKDNLLRFLKNNVPTRRNSICLYLCDNLDKIIEAEKFKEEFCERVRFKIESPFSLYEDIVNRFGIADKDLMLKHGATEYTCGHKKLSLLGFNYKSCITELLELNSSISNLMKITPYSHIFVDDLENKNDLDFIINIIGEKNRVINNVDFKFFKNKKH